jgi:hypothetical protein
MRLRNHFLALLCAVAWFGVSTDGASAAGCRAPRDAGDFAVIVKVDVGEPNVYNSMSKAQLGTSNTHGRERQILGTTNSGLKLRWSISYQIRDWKNVYCFWVASAEVEISYHQLDVNIASEYEPGSCQYGAVLDHEYEHVQVAQSVMQPYTRQIQQALTSLAIPTSHLPSVANSPEDAREEVEEVFRRTLGPVREKIDRLLQVNQAVVDTKENYRKTFRRCEKW